MENIEIKTCEICGFQTENCKVMSNHKRWKHIMPKGSDKYNDTCQKLSKSNKKEEITRTCICERCGKSFEQTHLQSQWNSGKNIRKFCSSQCAHSRAQTDETKSLLRDKLNEYYIVNVPNKKLIKSKTCPICGKVFRKNSNCCSNACAGKLKHLNYINTVGESLRTYRRECAFTFALNAFPDEFDFKLVEKFGWYAPKNSNNPNPTGVSRDHMVSVKWGWEHNIDPKIISHPANCRLILQSDNASKNEECSISYEKLLERIEVWNKKYGTLE